MKESWRSWKNCHLAYDYEMLNWGNPAPSIFMATFLLCLDFWLSVFPKRQRKQTQGVGCIAGRFRAKQQRERPLLIAQSTDFQIEFLPIFFVTVFVIAALSTFDSDQIGREIFPCPTIEMSVGEDKPLQGHRWDGWKKGSSNIFPHVLNGIDFDKVPDISPLGTLYRKNLKSPTQIGIDKENSDIVASLLPIPTFTHPFTNDVLYLKSCTYGRGSRVKRREKRECLGGARVERARMHNFAK